MKNRDRSGRRPFQPKKLWLAFLYSIAGLKEAILHERPFRDEALVLALMGVWLAVVRPGTTIVLILTGCWLLVMILELVNSSVEHLFDLVSRQQQPEIKAGKDMLSSAIFLAILFNLVLWIVLL
jgi:diacylglycerol kinase (ATP)